MELVGKYLPRYNTDNNTQFVLGNRTVESVGDLSFVRAPKMEFQLAFEGVAT